jgi:hypothetical protein
MFTILKVREKLEGDGDPGWYQSPAGTLADVAPEEDLRRDGIELAAATARAEARGQKLEWCGDPAVAAAGAKPEVSARIKVATR